MSTSAAELAKSRFEYIPNLFVRDLCNSILAESKQMQRGDLITSTMLHDIFIRHRCSPLDYWEYALVNTYHVLAPTEIKDEFVVNNDLRPLTKKLVPATNTVITTDAHMLSILDFARKIAPRDATVLLLGESGVGKDLVASFIQKNSNRWNKPFLKVNCGAMQPTLVENEIFGHEKGAFTDAREQCIGKLEAANGGILFLDEIGEASPELQTKLLRVLNGNPIIFNRLGSAKDIVVNVRFIAATNANLEKKVAEEKFREDLYFRLQIIPIPIPPLRDRREDIPLLANHFLGIYAEKNDLKTTPRLDATVIGAMLQHPWNGNVRELQSVIERVLIIHGHKEIIGLDDFNYLGKPMLNTTAPSIASVTMTRNPRLKDIVATSLEIVEKEAILRVLEETDWNRKETSRRLHICYKSLLIKIKKWQLTKSTTAVANKR